MTALLAVPPGTLEALGPGAPLVVQYLAQAQYLMPDLLVTAPGSRAFRQALRQVGESLPVQLMPSRAETRRALLTLHAAGALAPWLREAVTR